MAKEKKQLKTEEFQFVNQKRSIGPVIVVILLAALLIPLSVYAVRYVIELRSKAAPTEDPKNVTITNITDTAVTISWTTLGTETNGYAKYGAGSDIGNIAFDVRDQQNSGDEYNLHYVELTSLIPDTVYYFVLIGGGKEYRNGSTMYEFTTAPTLESVQTPFPVIGDVSDIATGTVEENIVYVYAKKGDLKSNTLSVITSDKRYTFDFANFRSEDLQSFFTDWDDAELYFSAYSASGKIGTVRTKIVQN